MKQNIWPILIWINLLLYFNLSESMKAIKVPGKIKDVILGQNSTNVKLTWIIDLEEAPFSQLKISRYKEEDPNKVLTYLGGFYRGNSKATVWSPKYSLNASSLSSQVYASLTIKDVLNQSRNSDGTEVDVLTNTYVYRIEVEVKKVPVPLYDTVKLRVFVLPRITYHTAKVYCKQGDLVELQCNASGHPAPRVQWTNKDMNKIIANSSTTILNITGKRSEGKYCCKVFNQAGNERNCTSVKVTEYQPISTVLTSNNNNAIRNKTIQLFCKADASPPAQYIIRVRNRKLATGNSTDGNITLIANGNGTYLNISCTAKNDYGEARPVYLRLPLYEIPVITSHSRRNITMTTNNFTLDCTAAGIPRPTITWYHQETNETVTLYDKETIRTDLNGVKGRLQVSYDACKNKTFGFFCKASNMIGNTRSPVITVEAIRYCSKNVINRGKPHDDKESFPNAPHQLAILIVVIVAVLIVGVLLLVCILISRKQKHSKCQINKGTELQDQTQNHFVEESPYGEPIDAIQRKEAIHAPSSSNAEYATVQETGYKPSISLNILPKIKRHDASEDKKNKSAVLNPLYEEVQGTIPRPL